MPRVAVLVPSYNHAKYLNACLASVRDQTFADWQAWVLDDGSTDGSVEVAARLAESDPRFVVEKNPKNLGTYGTEQRALDMSDSEYVAILNSDDFWEPEKLERQVAALDSEPAASGCYVLGRTVGADGSDFGQDVHADWPRTAAQHRIPHLLYENRILASGVLFRREGLRFETSCRYSGDWVALIEALERGPFVCLDQRLTCWRQHETNASHRSTLQMIEEIRVREAIASQEAHWLASDDPVIVRKALAQNAINLLHLHLYFLRTSHVMRWGREAVRLGWPRRAVLRRTVASRLAPKQTRDYLWRPRPTITVDECRRASEALDRQEPLVLQLCDP